MFLYQGRVLSVAAPVWQQRMQQRMQMESNGPLDVRVGEPSPGRSIRSWPIEVAHFGLRGMLQDEVGVSIL